MRSELNRKLDYSDYAAIPDDGKRYEVVEGALYVTPAPGTDHQHASKRLQRQLEDYFERRSLGEVWDAPLDVILGPHDIVQPDLVVVERREQVSKRGIEGAPLVVVEILSPSTRDHDRSVKSRRYAELGIPHFWLVDPDRRSVECHRLAKNTYRLLVRAEGAVALAHPDWDGLVLDLGALWR